MLSASIKHSCYFQISDTATFSQLHMTVIMFCIWVTLGNIFFLFIFQKNTSNFPESPKPVDWVGGVGRLGQNDNMMTGGKMNK